ncbi:hypothetical protein GmHk_18G051658 [Glycine max]|nr:hypothetical protein GmHk_18G051658 [Glycine max]
MDTAATYPSTGERGEIKKCCDDNAVMIIRSTAGDLIPIDLEINATCTRRNTERIRKFLQDLEAAATLGEEPRSSKASSSFPIPGQSHTDLIEERAKKSDPGRILKFHCATILFQYSAARVQAQTITYPLSLIQLIQNNLFHGLPNEDPYTHLATYIEICNIIRLVGVPEDAIRLSLFSFSLSGEAKRWLHSFKGNSLKTWDEAQNKLLSKQLEALTETLRCAICGGAHNSGCCIPNEEPAHEVNYMGNQARQNFNVGFSMASNIMHNRDSGGITLETSSTKTSVVHLIGHNNKGLVSMIEQRS